MIRSIKFKKLMSYILVIAMIITSMMISSFQSFADTEVPTYNGEAIIDGTTNFTAKIGTAKEDSLKYYYSDGYFKNDANQAEEGQTDAYNSHLATASMALSMSTINNTKGEEAKSFLDNIGCEDIASMGYDIDDSITAAVYGQKTLFEGTKDECTLIPVVVRSGYNGDANTNYLELGEEGDANGISQAADAIKTEVDKYIDFIAITGDIKLWITGYGFGGSIANILGGMYSAEFGQAYVYGYSFNALMSTIDTNASSYKNLFVVKNYNDIISMIFPSNMKFKFYGQAKDIGTFNDVKNRETEMLHQLSSVTSFESSDYHSPANFANAQVNTDINTMLTGWEDTSYTDILKYLNYILRYLSDSTYSTSINNINTAMNNGTFTVLSPTTGTSNTQKYCIDAATGIISKANKLAIKNRESYIYNANKATADETTYINIAEADLNTEDSVDPYTLEQAAGYIARFLENHSGESLEQFKIELKKCPLINYKSGFISGTTVTSNSSLDNFNILLNTLAFITEMDLSDWDNGFTDMISSIWSLLDTADTNVEYLGLSGMVDEGIITSEERDEIMNMLPIIMYTLGAIGAQETAAPYTLASVYYNIDSVKQAHYPEINYAWLCADDSFYSIEHHAAVANTCVDDGNSEYWYCNGCKKYFDDAACTHEIEENSWILPATGHNYNQSNKNSQYLKSAADCVNPNIYFKSCHCGASSEGTEDEATFTSGRALGHTMTKHAKVLPTKTDYGNEQYYECTRCKKYFNDKNGNTEIEKDSWVLEPTGEIETKLDKLKEAADSLDEYSTDADKQGILDGLRENSLSTIISALLSEDTASFNLATLKAIEEKIGVANLVFNYDGIELTADLAGLSAKMESDVLQTVNVVVDEASDADSFKDELQYDVDLDNAVLFSINIENAVTDSDGLLLCPVVVKFDVPSGIDADNIVIILKSGDDYTYITPTINDNEATILLDHFGDFMIAENHEHNMTTETIPATFTDDGYIRHYCPKCGYEDEESREIISMAATPVLSATAYAYNGNSKKPSVTIAGLTKDTDFSVKYSSSKPINVGSYTVTVTLKGKYSGTKKFTYEINPKKPTIKAPAKGKKSLTAKWKKISTKMSKTRITGYQVQIATDKNFTKNVKKYNVKGYTKTSKKISKLKAKQKYFVHVRTYKKVSGKTYYSAWSATKYVTTKK